MGGDHSKQMPGLGERRVDSGAPLCTHYYWIVSDSSGAEAAMGAFINLKVAALGQMKWQNFSIITRMTDLVQSS